MNLQRINLAHTGTRLETSTKSSDSRDGVWLRASHFISLSCSLLNVFAGLLQGGKLLWPNTSLPTTMPGTDITNQSLHTFLLCACSVAQLCPTLRDPMDCRPPGSSVHGISQARTLEWVTISFSGGSSWLRNQTGICCLGRWILYHWATWKAWAKPLNSPQCFRKLLQLHYSAAAAELCQHLSLFLEESVIFLNCILETSSFSRATLGRRELGK